MAEGFSFGAAAFYTRDTVRVRKQVALRERRRILLQQQEQLEQLEETGRPRQPSEVPSSYISATNTSFGEAEENVPTEGTEMKMEESMVMRMMEEETLKQKCFTPGRPQWTYRNLYATSISFMLVFSAFIGLQGLQSSLNAELGSASLAVTYGFYFLIGFVTTAIVRLFGTKYALLFGYMCHTVYIATNYYPEFFTLIPSSILIGIGSGPVWAGLSTHLGITAVIFSTSPGTADTLNVLLAKFTGIFFFIFQLAQIIGNLVSSLVLFPYSGGGENGTSVFVAGDTCDNAEAQNVTPTQTYILLSIYLLFNLSGIVTLLIFVSKIPKDTSAMMSMVQTKGKVKQYLTEPFIDLLRVLFSWKMLLLGPLSLFNGMEQSFAFSSYTVNVISNCVGVSKVGFALIVVGFFSATTSIIYGRLVKYIPRVFLGSTAAFINLFFLLFLQFYPLRPSYPLIFLFAIFWGIADGIWNTLSSSLVGILFPNHQDSAYSAFRIWMSLGFTIGFAITEVKSFSDTIWIMIAILLTSFLCYFLLEILNSKFGQKTCCKGNLGFFDGPKSNEDLLEGKGLGLTEEMLDAHLGDKSNSISESHHSYIPPTPVPRAVTYAAGDFNKKHLKNGISFLKKANSTNISGSGEEVIADHEEPGEDEDCENKGDKEKGKLFETAVF